MPETATLKDPTKDARKIPDLSSAAAASNGPDRDEFLFMVGQLAKADMALDEAKLARKKLRQHFQNRGVNLAMMDVAIEECDREDGTTVSNMRDLKRYLEFMGLPLGFQLSIFDEPQGTSSVGIEQQAFDEGRELGLKGINPDEQKWPPMTPEGQAHIKGWHDGQAVLLKKFTELSEEMKQAEAADARVKAEKDAKKAAKAAKMKGGEEPAPEAPGVH